MIKRVYVLEFESVIGLCVPGQNLEGRKTEDRIEYFSMGERDKFIKRYLYLKEECNVKNIKAYYGNLSKIEVEKIMGAI